jgi:hypothetical protein
MGMETRFGTMLDRRTLLGRAVLTYGSEFNLRFAKVAQVYQDDIGIPRFNCPEGPKITVSDYLHRIRRQADRRSFRRGLFGRGNLASAFRPRACIRRGGAETSETSEVEDIYMLVRYKTRRKEPQGRRTGGPTFHSVDGGGGIRVAVDPRVIKGPTFA